MKLQTFNLIPYPAEELPRIEIVGEVDRVENQYTVRYWVQGDVERILLPGRTSPTRKDDLWRATCFEFFLAVPDCPEYWEFNMSPSGEWNVYRMDAYRQVNMREEMKIHQLPFEFKRKDDRFSLDISVDLNPLVPMEQPLQAGITAILQTQGGIGTYWALAHPVVQADFHWRESFVLEV